MNPINRNSIIAVLVSAILAGAMETFLPFPSSGFVYPLLASVASIIVIWGSVSTHHDGVIRSLAGEAGVSAGDLGRAQSQLIERIKSMRERSQAENEFVRRFGAVCSGRSADVTLGMQRSIEQLSDKLVHLKQGISDQASSVDGIISNISSTDEYVTKTMERTMESAEMLAATSSQIRLLAADLSETMESINRLQELTRRITQSTVKINDFSDQTNMLALNAAIEAARAGEAGRGFSIVADEVRKLAENSANTTKAIEEEVAGIQRTVDDALGRLRKTSELAQNIGASNDTANKSASMVIGSLGNLEGKIGEITASVTEFHSAIGSLTRLAEEDNSILGPIRDAVGQIVHKLEELNALSVEARRFTDNR